MSAGDDYVCLGFVAAAIWDAATPEEKARYKAELDAWMHSKVTIGGLTRSKKSYEVLGRKLGQGNAVPTAPTAHTATREGIRLNPRS